MYKDRRALDQQRCPCLGSHVAIFIMARMVVHLYLYVLFGLRSVTNISHYLCSPCHVH